jgi:hypothetical protein
VSGDAGLGRHGVVEFGAVVFAGWRKRQEGELSRVEQVRLIW